MKNFQRVGISLMAVVLAVAGGCEQASRQGSAIRVTPTVSEPVRQAVVQLSAEDPDLRSDSLITLALALQQSGAEVEYVSQISLMIQQTIAGQVRAMASVQDPEAAARLAGVLEFNEALSRFVIDSMELPDERRATLLAWALHPDTIQLIARVYSVNTDLRVQAARELGKSGGPMTDELLARLIDDRDREVALTAMDAAGERAASGVVVEALWARAVTYPMANYGYPGFGLSKRAMNVNQGKVVYVRGRAIQIYAYNEGAYRGQDGEAAADVLIGFNSLLVREKLEQFFRELMEAPGDPNNYKFRVLSPNYGQTGATLFRLADAYKSKSLVPCVVAMATAATSDGYNNTFNNQPIRQSSRIDAIGLLVTLTGQDAEDYKLTRIANWGNRWMVSGDEKTEEAQVKKVREWWGKNYKEYGYKDAALPTGSVGPMGVGRGRRGEW